MHLAYNLTSTHFILSMYVFTGAGGWFGEKKKTIINHKFICSHIPYQIT